MIGVDITAMAMQIGMEMLDSPHYSQSFKLGNSIVPLMLLGENDLHRPMDEQNHPPVSGLTLLLDLSQRHLFPSERGYLNYERQA